MEEKNLCEIIENELGFKVTPDRIAEWGITIPYDPDKIKTLKQFFDIVVESIEKRYKVGIFGEVVEKYISGIKVATNYHNFWLELRNGRISIGSVKFEWKERECNIDTIHRWRKGVKDTFTLFFGANWKELAEEAKSIMGEFGKRKDLIMSTNLGLKYLMSGIDDNKQRCYLNVTISDVMDQIVRTNNLDRFLNEEIEQLTKVKDFVDDLLNFYKEMKELKSKQY